MSKPLLIVLTAMAMFAFAGDSLLCRLALRQTRIDAASFTSIRISSGAAALWLLLKFAIAMGKAQATGLPRLPFSATQQRSPLPTRASPPGPAHCSFSGSVGHDDFVGAAQKGKHLRARQSAGLALASAGLVLLVLPGVTAPSLTGSGLMQGAGIARGAYSLRGKGAGDPASATAGNFMRAVACAAACSVCAIPWAHFDRAGAVYALLSGAVTSGLGYVIWYTALFGLKAASAAAVQLSVPLLTAAGGILLLGEPLTVRFFCASVAILGGIALVVMHSRDADLSVVDPQQ
ncbi:MAG: DMT family transporter [Verrucomicrobiota bacterium]|nr:DMT family transporter [Verrucomicrobiota bacterium]